ncbi:MAG: hypothetical protein U0X71_07040 [Sphingobacteriaceae bacterium]
MELAIVYWVQEVQNASIDSSSGVLTGIRSGQVVVQVSQSSDSNYNSPVPISIDYDKQNYSEFVVYQYIDIHYGRW